MALALADNYPLLRPSPISKLIQKVWRNSTYFGGVAMALYEVGREFEEGGLYTFRYKHDGFEFEVSVPVSNSTAAFNDAVEQKFISCGGSKSEGAREALKQQKAEYLKRVGELAREKNLREPPARWRTEDHLRWLVEYQVPERLNVSQICKKYGLPFQTVDSGIKNARELIEISGPTNSLKGRKPGKGGTRKLSAKQEAGKKARLRRFIEACVSLGPYGAMGRSAAEVARKIGVSENHFRRAWIPYLLDITKCEDYEALARFAATGEAGKRH